MTVPHSLYVTAYLHVCSHAFDAYVSAMSDLINGVIIIIIRECFLLPGNSSKVETILRHLIIINKKNISTINPTYLLG